MNGNQKKSPIGMDNFEMLIQEGYYYVDKTGLIRDLLRNRGYVNLYTRPRRFGKTLNMSMLEAFFSPDSDKGIFDGLEIAKERDLCDQYMGKYPVIFITLKRIDAGNFATAYKQAVHLIQEEAVKVDEIPGIHEKLHLSERNALDRLLQDKVEEADLYDSLHTLSSILEKVYDQKVIILIDEYDVPLARANEYGYYDQMVLLIRNLFHQALKSNSSLQFAVLTGCMRISKESIFTGLNNLRVLGVTDVRSGEYFGFTDEEVREMLAYYGVEDRYEVTREWYDGYRFGDVEVYCPWDVVNYCDLLRSDPKAEPESYWINSSGNGIVREFLKNSRYSSVKKEIESLLNGEAVEKTIRQDLTYEDMYSSIENLWSVLLTTGYLTQRGRISANRFQLAIPNQEVRYIFEEQVMELFREDVQKDGETLTRFCEALKTGDAATAEQLFSAYLRKHISIRDTAARDGQKENFYHGVLLGILSVKEDWGVFSNKESGEGYSDILAEIGDYEMAIVIEVKVARDGNLEAACREALRQIEERHYAEDLYDDGYDHILKYGIACCKKRCRVMLAAE